MAEDLGVPIQVLNRGGAGGQAGTMDIATAGPDGYTNLPVTITVYLDPQRKADEHPSGQHPLPVALRGRRFRAPNPLTGPEGRRIFISVFSELPKEGSGVGINDVFQALSDPTRREILRLLQSGDMSAGEISQHFRLAKSTLSGHFNVLKHAGLIVTERQGTTIMYSMNVSAAEEALSAVLELFNVGTQPGRESS